MTAGPTHRFSVSSSDVAPGTASLSTSRTGKMSRKYAVELFGKYAKSWRKKLMSPSGKRSGIPEMACPGGRTNRRCPRSKTSSAFRGR